MMKRRILKKNCVVCGKPLLIELDLDNPTEEGAFPYKGGHYFGRPKINELEFEYWECDDCFNNDMEQVTLDASG